MSAGEAQTKGYKLEFNPRCLPSLLQLLFGRGIGHAAHCRALPANCMPQASARPLWNSGASGHSRSMGLESRLIAPYFDDAAGDLWMIA